LELSLPFKLLKLLDNLCQRNALLLLGEAPQVLFGNRCLRPGIFLPKGIGVLRGQPEAIPLHLLRHNSLLLDWVGGTFVPAVLYHAGGPGQEGTPALVRFRGKKRRRAGPRPPPPPVHGIMEKTLSRPARGASPPAKGNGVEINRQIPIGARAFLGGLS